MPKSNSLEERRVLVVGPIGRQPCAATDDVVAVAESLLGSRFAFQQSLLSDGPLPGRPSLDLTTPLRRWAPIYAFARVVASARWLRAARRRIARGDIHRVVAWDDVTVATLGTITPRSTEVVWIKDALPRPSYGSLAARAVALVTSNATVAPQGRPRVFPVRGLRVLPDCSFGEPDTEPGDTSFTWKPNASQASGPGLGLSLDQWVQCVLADPLTRKGLIAERGVVTLCCPVCGSAPAGKRMKTGAGTSAIDCAHCGQLFADRTLPPSQLHTAGYYSGIGHVGTNYESATAARACRDIADARLSLLTASCPPPSRILDVGAGLGYFVERACEHGWNASGIEISHAAVATAKSRNIPVEQGDVSSFTPSTRFNAVCLGQTLEHLHTPVTTLRHVREHILEPDGALLVEVPNTRSVARSLAGQRWMHWQPGDHVLHFNVERVERLLARAGFCVTQQRTTSFALPWLDTTTIAHNLGLCGHPVSQALVRLVSRSRIDPTARTSLLAIAAILDRAGFGQDMQVVALPA